MVVFKANRAKVFVIVNALKENYKRMRIGGTQAWWDSRNIANSIPVCIPLERILPCSRPLLGLRALFRVQKAFDYPFWLSH